MSVTVSVTLTDEEYEIVKEKASDEGLTISQYVKRFPIGADDFDFLYERLKDKAIHYPYDKPFTVMSLFPDWDKIERGTKLSLGRNFYHLVKRGDLPPVDTAGKNSSNIQLYVVKKNDPMEKDEFDICYEYLKQQAVNYPEGQVFTVKTVFPDWNKIGRGTRLLLGRNFYNLVKNGELPPVVPAGKNGSNMQLYMTRKN